MGSSGHDEYRVRTRDPEPQELTNLRNGLYSKIYPGLQSFDAKSWETAQNTANSALATQNSLLSQLPNSLNKSNNAVSEMLNVAHSGNIPSALTDSMNASVNQGLKSSMGSMLNSLANRGVLNSSVTTAGTNQLSQAAADAYNKNYLSAYQATLSGLGQGAQLAQNDTASLLSGLQAVGNVPSQAYQGAYAGLMPAYNFWKDWQNSYDGRQDYDTIVTQGGGSCVTGDTLVRLSDGREIPVSELKDDEQIVAWDFDEGKEYPARLAAFFKSTDSEGFDVIRVRFDDGSNVGVIREHLFFDLTEGQFVAVNAESLDYIGHEFAKVDAEGKVIPVRVVGIEIGGKAKKAYAPQAEGYYNFLANGFITGNDGQLGICNRFDVDLWTMTYDEDQKAADIKKYGILDYEKLSHVVSEEMFRSNRMNELSVAFGKGLVTMEYLEGYLKKFADSFLE